MIDDEKMIKIVIPEIKKWCEENGIKESPKVVNYFEPATYNINDTEDGIFIAFKNDTGNKFSIIINDWMGFFIQENVREIKKFDESGKPQYVSENIHSKPVHELDKYAFGVIQSWFAKNSSFTKFPDIKV